MRKRNYTMAVLLLAGAMTVGGAGMLSHEISRARGEELVSTGKKPVDAAAKSEDLETQEAKLGGEKVYQERGKIYLPNGAEIKEEIRRKETAGYRVSWNGYDIFYETSGGICESKADISIGDAVEIAERAVKKFSGQDVSGKKVNIFLGRYVPEEGDSSLIPLDTDIREDSGELLPEINKKNYGVRYYSLSVHGVKNHCFLLRINSVTGEVFCYADYYEKASDGFRRYHGRKEKKKVKQEFTAIAGNFVKNSLEFGDVKEYYAFHSGLMETEKSTRETFDVYCRTEEDDIVVVTLDQQDRKVLCFEINPLLGE